MNHPAPHRVRPRLQALIVTVLIGLGALLPLVRPYPLAVQSDPSLPGGVPKAPPYLAGFPKWFPQTDDYRNRQGAVVLADIDGDGRKDLVVSVPTGQIQVLDRQGTLLPGWPRGFPELAQPASPVGEPAVGDLDGDGSPEIVTCVVSDGTPRRTLLYALRSDGTDLTCRREDGSEYACWPVDLTDYSNPAYSCTSTPTVLADLDGDGHLEVIRGMSRGTLLALDRSGRPLQGGRCGWPVRLGPDGQGRIRDVNADLVVADLSGDGKQDLIFVESGLESRLAAVSFDGCLLPGFPVTLDEIVDRQAPAVADMVDDGNGVHRIELAQATSPYLGDVIDPGIGPARPARLHLLRADGTNAPGWPRVLKTGAPWGPAITELNGDGRPDILQEDGTDLVGFDANGNTLSGYPIVVRRDFVRSQSLETSPWVVGDLDGDGERDLLQVWSNLYAGQFYLRVFGLRATGNPIRGFPFDTDGRLAVSRPVLVDLSGDGVNDLVMLVKKDGNGGWILGAWDLGSLSRPSR
jgi:FG-GAP-like repeat